MKKLILVLSFIFCFTFVFTGCSDSSDTSALQSQINELKVQLRTTNNNDDIASLQQQIANLESQLDNANDDINDLKTKVLLLQGSAEGDTDKVYQMGDTITYSSNGLKLFSVKPIEITSATNDYRLKFELSNYNIPQITTNAFLHMKLFDKTNNMFINQKNATYPYVNINEMTIFTFGFPYTSSETSEIYFYLGICIDDYSSNNFIPFAIVEV